jgi:hypothetical protein
MSHYGQSRSLTVSGPVGPQVSQAARMLTEAHDVEEIIDRVAGLDIGKAELTCCVRVPNEGRPGRRLQEVVPSPRPQRPGQAARKEPR